LDLGRDPVGGTDIEPKPRDYLTIDRRTVVRDAISEGPPVTEFFTSIILCR
jgi:hypothetical protein